MRSLNANNLNKVWNRMNYLVAWKERSEDKIKQKKKIKDYLHNRNSLEETSNIIAQ